MSKGLEYDHVIALGVATRYEKPPEIILKRIDHHTCLGPVFKDQLSFDALHDLDMEKLRQLYVAITRAKKSLHMPIIDYDMQDVMHSCLSPLEFYILLIKHADLSYKELYNHVSGLHLDHDIPEIFTETLFEFIESIDDVPSIPSSFHLQILDKSLPVCQVVEDKVVSFSSLKTDSDFEKTDDPLKGRDFGDFFHMLMQELLTHHYYQDFSSNQSQDYFKLLIEISPFNEHKEAIIQYLQNCLELKFPTSDEEFFCIKDIAPCDLYVETPFSYKTELGKMKGVIDCTVIYKNKLYFIDWKTSFLKDTSQEGLSTHMKKASYDLQLDIYKTALILQKDYFNHIALSKAFYVFVKHASIYEKNLEENICLT
jgi:ATP-dependent exoDNAse (exonuclease V) beta subunit